MRARWPVMVRLAYGLTGDQGHAEDVAQTAFARAYASRPKVSRTDNPEAYAHAPAGLIASGTINGQAWKVAADQPGTHRAGPGQQNILFPGSVFGDAHS